MAITTLPLYTKEGFLYATRALSNDMHLICLSDKSASKKFSKIKKEIVYKEKAEMCFEYRKSILQAGQYILLGAEFELKKAAKYKVVCEILKDRKSQ